MVSLRCILSVKNELRKMGLRYRSVVLGQVQMDNDITETERTQLNTGLMQLGLKLLSNKKETLVEKIKNVVTNMVHYSEDLPKTNYSEFISFKLSYDYTYLANLFHEVTGSTIQQFIIKNKVERVKELLLDDELNITEISYKMHYSSVAHLSNQFRKITGLSPSAFKNSPRRDNLELI